MLTLALDTTTRAGSVAVLHGTTVLSSLEGDATRTHGERLPAEIERALADAGVERAALQLLVVASGPGAFTGLRIGLATMQGLAMVLGLPVIGLSALDAMAVVARDVTERRASAIATWMDAQRGEVFGAFYPADAPPHGVAPSVGLPAAILRELPESASDVIFIGDGAVRHAPAIQHQAGTHATILEHPLALARVLGMLGQERAARGEAGPPHALQPLYVRRPDAELERDRQRGRQTDPEAERRDRP